jgi:hypothetical protein
MPHMPQCKEAAGQMGSKETAEQAGNMEALKVVAEQGAAYRLPPTLKPAR